MDGMMTMFDGYDPYFRRRYGRPPSATDDPYFAEPADVMPEADPFRRAAGFGDQGAAQRQTTGPLGENSAPPRVNPPQSGGDDSFLSSILNRQPTMPTAQRPEAKYVEPHLSIKQKLLGVLGSFLPIDDDILGNPYNKAQRSYENQLQVQHDFDTTMAQGRAARNEQRDIDLTASEIERNRNLASRSFDRAPSTEVFRDRRRQWDPDTKTWNDIGPAADREPTVHAPSTEVFGRRRRQWDPETETWNDIGPAPDREPTPEKPVPRGAFVAIEQRKNKALQDLEAQYQWDSGKNQYKDRKTFERVSPEDFERRKAAIQTAYENEINVATDFGTLPTGPETTQALPATSAQTKGPPAKGSMWVNRKTGERRQWNGSKWKVVTPARRAQ